MRSKKWSSSVSKLLLQTAVTIWKHRCEVIHHLKEGTDEASVRSNLLAKALEIQSQPWRLLPSDRHLCKRSIKFFDKARIANLLMWKKRIVAAEEMCEKKNCELGTDLSKHFQSETTNNRLQMKGCIVRKDRNDSIFEHEIRIKTRKRIHVVQEHNFLD